MKHRKLGYFTGMAVIALACAGILGMGQAHATPETGPDQQNFWESNTYGNSYPGWGRDVDYVVATSAFNTILQTTLNIYMPTSSGTIVIHDPNICYGTFRNGARNYDQIDDGVGANWGFATSFNINGNVQWGYFDNSATCDVPTLTFNVSGAAVDPSTGLYKYTLVVNANPAGDLYTNSFWVVAPAGSFVSQDSSQITSSFAMNMTYPIPGGSNPPGTQDPPWPYEDYWNGAIPFAPDCTVTTPTVTKRLEIYDDDNHNNWDVQPRPFLFRLIEYDRSGAYQRDLTPTISFPDGGGTWQTIWGPWYDVYGGGNNHRIWLDYTFKRDMVYVWQLDSVYYDNTLQFRLPFDNVYYYRACQTGNYDLQPNINVTVNGGAVAGNVAELGDTVQFTYAVNNAGSTDSTSVDCTIYGKTYNGYQAVPSPNDSSSNGGYVPPGTGCPRVFPLGNTTLTTETIVASTANRTICRSLWVNPATPAGGPESTEVCVLVTAKPYLRAYGGDVSAGNGFTSGLSGSCTLNNDGAVVSWNTEGPLYSGAGAQFAVLALNQIYDFATTLGNTGGAPPPSSLAFANQTVSGGNFGGSLGSVPCIDDYYAKMPSSATTYTGPNLNSLGSGAFKATGPITLSGLINGSIGQRTSIYVQGDVIIDDNITYLGVWDAASVPLFQLVVQGNIYIDSSVTQLDGVYIAQRTGGSGGVIYTCASGNTPIATNALAGTCDNKLTVNGSFAAYQVQFLRAAGSLKQSSTGETSAASKASEVFNYGPTFWIPFPPDFPISSDYDSITSLPPIL